MTDSKYTIFLDMKRQTKEILFSIALIILAVLALVFITRPSYQVGTLYMGDKQEQICEGQLKTIRGAYGTVSYEFTCSNGQIIRNVTNFVVR